MRRGVGGRLNNIVSEVWSQFFVLGAFGFCSLKRWCWKRKEEFHFYPQKNCDGKENVFNKMRLNGWVKQAKRSPSWLSTWLCAPKSTLPMVSLKWCIRRSCDAWSEFFHLSLFFKTLGRGWTLSEFCWSCLIMG